MDVSLLLPLIGIPVVVLGFALRFNPLLVVTTAGLATGLASGMSLVALLETFGEKFLNSRQLATFILILPVIGLLERAGLQERARILIRQVKAATAGRLLLVYFMVRQATAALGLVSLGGHPQMVRPLVAPMAESAAEAEHGPLPGRARFRIRAMAAATDNIGLFFGEDIFIAIGSIVLIVGFLEQAGIRVEALHVSLWAIPTAIVALLVHGARLLLFDRRVKRDIAAGGEDER